MKREKRKKIPHQKKKRGKNNNEKKKKEVALRERGGVCERERERGWLSGRVGGAEKIVTLDDQKSF